MQKGHLSKIVFLSLLLAFILIPITAMADTTGTLPLDGSVTGSILVNDANNQVTHIYKITIPEDGKLHFSLKPDGNLFPSLTLLDADMKKSRGSASYSDATKLTYLICGGLAAGTYYIAVEQGQPYNHQVYSGGYTLSNTFESIGATADAQNDTKNAAIKAVLNSDTIGHIGYEYNNYRDVDDWYYVDITDEGALNLSVEGSDDLQVNIQLLDGDKLSDRGGVYFTHNNSDIKERIIDGLGKGRYYLHVTLVEPYTRDYYYGLYTLETTFTATKYKNNNEPNENKDTAISIPQSGEITANLGYAGNDKRDSQDWYSIETDNDGVLNLKMEPTKGLHAYINLLDGDGARDLGSFYFTESTSDKFSETFAGLAKGKYYIRITLVEPYTRDYYFGSYKLISSFTPAKYAPDKEPNNDRNTATNLGKVISGTINGHVGYYYNGYYDPEDWYKMTIDGPSISLNLERAPENGIGVALMDANGNEIKRESENKTNTITVNGLKPGTYLITAWPLTIHQNTRYSGSYSISYKAAGSTASITKITPDPSVLTMNKGQKKGVKIKALIAGAAPKIITDSCTFKLANNKIAKIDKNGNVTTLSKGKVKVDVTYNKFKTSFTIIVK